MNPEAEFQTHDTSKYAGMDLQEYPFATLQNNYGKEETYCLDVISSPEKSQSPCPVVIFIHGGGFVKNNDKRQGYIPVFARALTKAGYIVVSPDYPIYENRQDRNDDGGDKTAADRAAVAIHAAYEYVQQNAKKFNMDAARVALMGGSAGGMTGFAAIANYSDPYRLFVNCWGAIKHELPDMSSFPPVLSIHGTEDQLVDYELELPIQAKLEELGIRHELITLEGARHTPMGRFDEFIPKVLAYLEETMK